MRSPLDEFRGGSYSPRERRRGPFWAPSPLRMRGLAGDRARRIAGGLGARPSVLVLLILLLRLLRHTLAEGVALVLVGAVLLLEVRRILLLLGLAVLGGIDLVLVGLVRRGLVLLGVLRDALAERVLAVLVGAVLQLERRRVLRPLGLALIDRVALGGLLLLLVELRVLRHALAERVLPLLVGGEHRAEVRVARRLAQRLTELRRVLLVLLRRPVVAERSGRKRQRDGGRRRDCNSLGHA